MPGLPAAEGEINNYGQVEKDKILGATDLKLKSGLFGEASASGAGGWARHLLAAASVPLLPLPCRVAA